MPFQDIFWYSFIGDFKDSPEDREAAWNKRRNQERIRENKESNTEELIVISGELYAH